MRYLSLFSGIEAATAAWHELGWQPVAFSEIDPFACAVLKHHYPHVPNWGDITKHSDWPHEPVDLIVGGSPCQAFSIAGFRKGLDDPRGNLTLTYLAVVSQYRPTWVVWENVPGILSIDGGRTFGTFLRGLGKLGYGFAYRVLDAQYFGVPQRRRRVFVVGYLGDWRRAAAVLFERHSLSGHPPPSRATRERPASTAEEGAGSSGISTQHHELLNTAYGCNRTSGSIDVAGSVLAKGSRLDFESETFIAFDCKASGRNGFGVGELAPTLRSMSGATSSKNGGGHAAVAVSLRGRAGGSTAELSGEVATALRTGQGGADKSYVMAAYTTSNQAGKVYAEYSTALDRSNPPPALHTESQVRRLSPVECERLQGFPDDYTRIPKRLYKSCHITPSRPKDMWDKANDGWMLMSADGARYKALGNSMARPVMHWIGKRIVLAMKLDK
ncbi:DNA cytosine methyltransferase [Chitinimonas sp. PSY-7]|uniref:DNA (cytosine-5-)-methyltransferase n=1 Tax=Chitinimonas sp. PSY-7 TaxID=3459088 RepID=UPI0040402E36